MRLRSMMRVRAGMALCVGISTTAGAADPAGPMAAAFGAREAVQQMSLSPDGTHVAMIVPVRGHGAALRIANMTTGEVAQPILSAAGDPETLTSCRWATDIRVICQIRTASKSSFGLIGFSRTVAINRDGSAMKMLSARTNDRSLGMMQDGGSVIDWTADGVAGAVLMTRSFVPEMTTGMQTASSGEGLGVERIDSVTLARRTIEAPRGTADEYISDGRGMVRIMGLRSRSNSGYETGRTDYLYRKPGDRAWLPLSRLEGDQNGTGFNPYAVDPALNIAYGFDDKDGRQALFKVALDGTLKRELVLAHPDVDVDGLIRIGRQSRVVGATYATDRREVAFFDPALRALAASLNAALPGKPIVTFIDASADENTLLLFAGSDVDPGRYYLLDRKTRKMGEVMPARAQLAGIPLGSVKPISFRAADGTMIPGYLTLPAGSSGKGLPAIVMPHGGPGARDEWGFDWLPQFFAARGFAVLQPNFRGSTGYGSAWFQKNGFQSWRTAIGDVDDAGRWLVAQGIAAPATLAIVGWSYGGYAALQSAVTEPGLFKAIVAVAPVTDLDAFREEARGFTSYTVVDAFIGHGPHVQAGSPARHADRITAPVLMFHGDRDRNVGIDESRLMASRLKGAGGKVELVEFPGLDHQLDDDGARTLMLAKADAFLRNAMGM